MRSFNEEIIMDRALCWSLIYLVLVDSTSAGIPDWSVYRGRW